MSPVEQRFVLRNLERVLQVPFQCHVTIAATIRVRVRVRARAITAIAIAALLSEGSVSARMARRATWWS